MSLNLASQPFVNSRPVRRVVLFLWCLSAALVIANLFFYARHFSGQQERRERLDTLNEQEVSERDRLAALEQELAGFDLEWQNEQVEFLNLRIAERVFPWSRLFDRLTEALPRQVRLTRLRPTIDKRSRSRAGSEESVKLEIRAEARKEEAILDFIVALFEHPAFRAPNLASESRVGNTPITEFALTVAYLPALAEPTPETETLPAVDAAAAAAEAAPAPAADEQEEADASAADGEEEDEE